MPRAIAFIVLLVAVACGLAFAATRMEGARAAQQPLVDVDTTARGWRAPGAPFRVRGSAAPGAVVTLYLGERAVDRETVGAAGRFVMTARPPEPGRHAVSVGAGGRRWPAGTVLVRPVTLAAFGDVMLERDDPTVWSSVGRVLRSADIATGNLEGVLSTRGLAVADKDYTFRGPPQALARMRREAGVDVVSVANNHALDFGREAFLDTIANARRAGVETVGGGADLEAARAPVVLVRGGLRIAFLGYSDVNPLGFPAGAGVAGTARAWPEQVAADVARARKGSNVVVVWFHWGEELVPEPSVAQRRLAEAALGAGATVVLGAHPHVLGGVATPRSGRLVAWSLGNFVFPSFRDDTTATGILLVELGYEGVRGFELRDARIRGTRPELR
jgi:hypothetical protein